MRLVRAVRLSHQRMGQSFSSIRAHSPAQCRFHACALASTEVLPGGGGHVAIAVLMPFHPITTTDSVERINGGLAKSPIAVLNPLTSSPKDAAGRVYSWRCVSRPLRDVTLPLGPSGKPLRHVTRLTRCKAACRAPGRVVPGPYGPATRAWVKIRAHGLE